MNHVAGQVKTPDSPEGKSSGIKDFFLILLGSMLFAHLLACDVPVNDVSEGGKSICPDPNKKPESLNPNGKQFLFDQVQYVSVSYNWFNYQNRIRNSTVPDRYYYASSNANYKNNPEIQIEMLTSIYSGHEKPTVNTERSQIYGFFHGALQGLAEIDYQQIDFSTLDGTTNLQNHGGAGQLIL